MRPFFWFEFFRVADLAVRGMKRGEISRQDFVLEESHVTHTELACASGGLPFSIQFNFLQLGVFPNLEEVVEGNDNEVSYGNCDGVGRGGVCFVDVLDKGDEDGELGNGRRVLAAETLQLLTDRNNVATLTLGGGTMFASQVDGRGDGCQG